VDAAGLVVDVITCPPPIITEIYMAKAMVAGSRNFM